MSEQNEKEKIERMERQINFLIGKVNELTVQHNKVRDMDIFVGEVKFK